MLRLPHSEYYRDRNSEYELCQDFPADEIFIEGLHAMQLHMINNGIYIDIPVVRVMNTAHFLAAYMFATTCSGDQMEYDVIAYDSLNCDRQLMLVTMVVLAAMLKRTDGFRASHCRNVILADRSPDFEEGVTLYDRFLRSAEERFEEEAFLIDTHAQIQKLTAENEQLTSENIQLKYTITNMEEKYQQINIGSQTNIGTQNNFNITYAVTPTDTPSNPSEPAPQIELFRFIHPSITDEAERLQIHREVVNLVTHLPLPEVCRYLQQMKHDNRVFLCSKPETMFDELHRLGLPPETVPGFSKKNFMNYYNIN